MQYVSFEYSNLCNVTKLLNCFTPPGPTPIGERSTAKSVCVCVCVCLFAIISSELHGRSSPSILCMLPMAVVRSFWRRSDRLCTSGFMNYVIFPHKPTLLDVAAQLKRSAHAALSLAINCAQYYQMQANGHTGLLFGRLK